MRRFQLHRDHDVTGVSGTGLVAEGAAFYGGATRIVWVDPPREKVVRGICLEGAAAFERITSESPRQA
jgi:hypothetical protein